ncbi:MAG: hypothetical protein ABIJ53_03495, partial [Verrucomicrobiota bacterium]
MNKVYFSLVVGLFSSALLFAQTDGSLLFQDKFEGITSQGTVQHTQAEVFASPDKAPGGKIQGTAEVVDGKVGKAIRLHGESAITYMPAKGNIDPTGGEISFWVSLNFDPMVKNEKTRGPLRNQSFFKIWDPSRGYTSLNFYNASEETYCLSVVDERRNIAFYISFKQVWKPFEWHH